MKRPHSKTRILLWCLVPCVLTAAPSCLDPGSDALFEQVGQVDPSLPGDAASGLSAPVSTVVQLETAAPIQVSAGASASLQLFAVSEETPHDGPPVKLTQSVHRLDGRVAQLEAELPAFLPNGALFHLVVRLDGDGDGGLCGGANDYFGVSAWFALDDSVAPERLSVPLATLAPHLPCVAL